MYLIIISKYERLQFKKIVVFFYCLKKEVEMNDVFFFFLDKMNGGMKNEQIPLLWHSCAAKNENRKDKPKFL